MGKIDGSAKNMDAEAVGIRHYNATNAAKDLAELMERDLGYPKGYVDSVALRLFIQAKWRTVSVLAHRIYEGID